MLAVPSIIRLRAAPCISSSTALMIRRHMSRNSAGPIGAVSSTRPSPARTPASGHGHADIRPSAAVSFAVWPIQPKGRALGSGVTLPCMLTTFASVTLARDARVGRRYPAVKLAAGFRRGAQNCPPVGKTCPRPHAPSTDKPPRRAAAQRPLRIPRGEQMQLSRHATALARRAHRRALADRRRRGRADRRGRRNQDRGSRRDGRAPRDDAAEHPAIRGGPERRGSSASGASNAWKTSRPACRTSVSPTPATRRSSTSAGSATPSSTPRRSRRGLLPGQRLRLRPAHDEPRACSTSSAWRSCAARRARSTDATPWAAR